MRQPTAPFLLDKATCRRDLHNIRKAISPVRQLEARQSCFDELYPILFAYDSVLSFASFGDEIDLWPLNHKLAADNRLLLPKIEGQRLRAFKVRDLERDLTLSRLLIREPNPKLCDEVQPKDLSLILVPGLGFDLRGFRIGYGKGFYDRFLRLSPQALKIGIGFREQIVREGLPTTPNDVQLDEIKLF